MPAFCVNAMKAETRLENDRLIEAEKVENSLYEQGATSSGMQEVFSILQLNVKVQEVKRDKQTGILTKVIKLTKQTCVRVVSLCAAEIPELREKIQELLDKVEADV